MNYCRSRSFTPLFLVSAISTILSACGGGSNASSEGSQQLSGAVADGYIRGAIVCADLNANDTCDLDEPSAISGVAGAYALTIPEGVTDVEIIADIPATAIDEDTNTEVGSALVFKAPLSRPGFISPITTLVQQARQDNPSLDIDGAEASVKGMLGLENNDDLSLFDDYVDRAEELVIDDSGVNQYRYLHETARVVTSVMKDIETQLSAAAQTDNIDVADPEVRGAIRDIVRREVAELLPNIGERVSQVVSITETSSGSAGTGTAPTSQVDAEQLARELRPTDLAQRVEERIESALTRPAITLASVENLLDMGMYAIEIDCQYEFFEQDDDTTTPSADVVITPDSTDLDCVSIYTDIQRDMASGELQTIDYEWSPASSTWDIHEEADDDYATDFALVDGQWVETGDIDPNGSIEFMANGEAVITSENGSIAIKAVSQNLENVPVEHHLLETEASHVWFEDSQSDVFGIGSIGYRLSIEESPHPYVLFNYPHGFSQSSSDCSEFSGNCNVITIDDNGEFTVATSLNEIRERSTSEVKIKNDGYESFGQDAPLFILTAEATIDGAFPRNGTAIWPINFTDAAATLTEPSSRNQAQSQADTASYTCATNVIPEQEDVQLPIVPGKIEIDVNSLITTKPDNSLIPPRDPFFRAEAAINFPAHDKCETVNEPEPGSAQADAPDSQDQTSPTNQPLPDNTISSHWRIITVDGVSMIEISLPIALRHNSHRDNDAALLLIEQHGVVRLGTRLHETDTSTFYTYNDTALEVLQQKVIRLLGQSSR